MAGLISRGLSLVVVVGYVIAALLSDPGPPPVGRVRGPELGRAGAAAIVGLAALVPLAFIWFPDFFGEQTGGRVTRETPSWFVAAGGWMVLVGVPLALIWFRAR